MKRFKSLYIVGVAAIVLASSSCKKYLTEDPSTSFSANFVYNTPEGLDMGVVALYNLNRSFYENGEWNFAVPFLLQAKTDLVLGRTGEASLYSTLAWGATLGDFGTTRYSHFWKTYYKIIDRSNAIIKYGTAVQMDESKKNELLAQARFFRAHSYFILYKLFNNIYITTEPTTPQNAANIITDKSSKEDIFKLIEEDLDYARTHLKWEISQPGRVTKGTATHVLAQVALWKQDNQKALDLAKEVIGSVQHALLPSTAEVFKGTLNHKESLFVIQYKAQTFGGGVPHRFNFLLLPQYGATPGAQYDNTMGGRGAGFLLLNDYFRDLLNQDPMDDRAKGSYYISTFYFNNPSTLPAGKKIGDVIDTYDEMSSNVADRNLFYARLNPGCIKFANETGLPNEVDQSKNIMVYRVAETYLIAAEAAWKLGLDSEGLKYINAIRTRAKAAPITELTLTSILDEDARELGFEGQRWYTLKRLGVMTQQMTKYAGNSRNGLYQANARTLFKNHMVNLPIPQAEMNLLGLNTHKMMVIKKIKYMLTGIIASLAMTSYAQEQQFESTPTWSEEFNYEGRPDSLKWEFDYGTGQHGWGNNELQYYVNTAQNIMVSNGTLKIHAIHEATNGMAYSSSKIKTLGKNGFKYGRIEVSAKVPPQVGTWPAVWMMPVHSTYGGWPRSGEIDIIEHVGYDPKQLHITVHTLDYNGMNNNQKGSNTYVEKAISEFNTYRIDWTEEGITGYINDKKVYEYPNTGKGYASWPFDQEFYLIVNLAVGGDWGGRKGVENETFPATFELDYIRYYPLKSK